MSDALSAAVSIGFHGLAFAMVLYLISVGLSVTIGAAWAAENNPKSDGAPEMIIAARRKLTRQLRLGSGTSLGLCRLLYRRMSRFARTGHDCSAEHHKRQCRCDGVV